VRILCGFANDNFNSPSFFIIIIIICSLF
jgi:hypothetical protein